MFLAFAADVPALAEVLAVAAMTAAPSTSATSNPIPTRLIPCPPLGVIVVDPGLPLQSRFCALAGILDLVRFPNEDSTTVSKWSQA
jgi:hypothetical protein